MLAEQNIMTEVIDEILEDRGAEKETFEVKDDVTADWCMDKIREEQAEIKRFEMVVNSKINTLKRRLETLKNEKERSVTYFEGKLRDYFETLNIKPTKAGNKSYKLPGGKLNLKKQQPQYKREDDNLVTWLKDNGKNDLIQTKETPKWGELKKICTVTENGKVVTADGEIVAGVTAESRPNKFSVDV